MTAIIRILLFAAALAALLAAALFATATSPLPPSPTSSTPPAATTYAAAPVAPAVDTQAPDGSLDGNGTYIVGADVQPGTYTSAGAAGGLHGVCYWSRLARLDRRAEAAIQQGAGRDPQTVTIAASDAAFKTAGCQQWEPTP